MGYRTPHIDRLADEGMLFTDSYAEQSCTAGRSAFITGQCVFRTGLSKVGLPGADLGLRAEDPTIAELSKPHGYANGIGIPKILGMNRLKTGAGAAAHAALSACRKKRRRA
jgi:arylsulfatase A-like enzyme